MMRYGIINRGWRRLRRVWVLLLLLVAPGLWLHASDAVNAHYQLHGKATPLAENGIHDPMNDAIDILQSPESGMANFPRSKDGVIDWIGVLDNGLASPRVDVKGKEEIFSADFDVIMRNTSSMPYVRFPHLGHTKWLTCKNCHPSIFLPQKGGNFVSMAAIMEGEYCGVCHGKVAFPPLECAKCHNVPKDSTGLR